MGFTTITQTILINFFSVLWSFHLREATVVITTQKSDTQTRLARSDSCWGGNYRHCADPTWTDSQIY